MKRVDKEAFINQLDEILNDAIENGVEDIMPLLNFKLQVLKEPTE